jgi:hypothetical protein
LTRLFTMALLGIAACNQPSTPLQGVPGKCLSGTQGLPNGAVNPANDCQLCVAAEGQVGTWTNAPEDSSCDAGVCLNGVCAPPPDGTPCDGGVFVSRTCTPGCWLSDAGNIGPTQQVGPGFVPPTTYIDIRCLGCRPEVSVTDLTHWPTGTRCQIDGGLTQACYILPGDLPENEFCTCDANTMTAPDAGVPCCDGTPRDSHGVCCASRPC